MKHNASTPNSARLGLGTAALVILALASCDAPFTPPDAAPAITAFSVDTDRLAEGATMTLEASATGPRNIERVRFVFTGALQRDTVVTLATPRGQVTAQATFTIPNGTGPDSLAQVTAIAVDANNISSPASDPHAFVIVDATPPGVTTTTNVTSVAGGHNLQVTVRGTDNRGVTVVGVIREFAGQVDTMAADTVPAATAPRERVRTFTIPAPQASSSAFTVRGFATDVSGFESLSAPASVEITDGIGPAIEMRTDKPQYPLGDSIRVTVRLEDPSGIVSVNFVGRSIRGRPDHGEDEFFIRFPAKTVTYPRTPASFDTLPKLIEALHQVLHTSDHETAELVEVIVTATDGLGNVSQASQWVEVGGPHVEILFPANDPSHVRTSTDERPSELQVRVKILDTQPISEAWLRLIGIDGYVIAPDSITILPPFTATDTIRTVNISIPEEEGSFIIQAGAVNNVGIRGRREVTIEASAEAAMPADDTPPMASLRFSTRGTPVGAFTRLEFTDTLTIHMTADDSQSGLTRMGIWAMMQRRGAGTDTLTAERLFAVPSTNQEELEVAIPLDSLYTIMGLNTGPGALDALTPDTMRLQIFAFAVDDAGFVSCAVGLAEQRVCTPVSDSAGALFRPLEGGPLQTELIAVRGRTLHLSRPGSLVADLAIDQANERLYLSNITHNLVQPVQLHTNPNQISFMNEVQVGSQPWGLFVGRRVVGPGENSGYAEGAMAPTLIVANSGGTNMSMVNLHPTAAQVREVSTVRVHTPNSVIYQVSESQDDFGNTKYNSQFFDFSDRPQFVAQDSLLRLVYSTVPTGAANTSTIRFGMTDPDPTATGDTVEVRLLITTDMVSGTSDDYVVANVDHLEIRPFAEAPDQVELTTHEPGYPGRPIFSGFHEQFADAAASLESQLDAVMAGRGVPEEAALYYPFLMRGSWDFQRLGMSDTTFVTASADGGRIAIGEGARAPVGRIVLWHANPCDPVTLTCATMSSAIEIMDLVSNASERVLGVGLNLDGSLGVARGLHATYFFTPDLRLQGQFQQAEQGGAGATFHPGHNSLHDGSLEAPDNGAAFTGTSNRSIEVVNTFHFNLINTLRIRDNIVGPLRSGPPLAGDPTDVVAKLYGITDVGGIVVVNVRASDLEP